MPWVEVEGKSSAELRDNYVEHHAMPLAKRTFDADPDAQSLVLAVGQFWCDEAEDAVHIEFVPSTSTDPKWPECTEDEAFFVEDDGWWELNERGEALVGWKARQDLPQLDDNSSAISAFAAYCLEDCDQEMPTQEAHTPYAIIRRADEGGPTIEVVGEKIQPQWEDRFDVGFPAEGDAEQSPAPATSGVGGWLKRLFGKG